MHCDAFALQAAENPTLTDLTKKGDLLTYLARKFRKKGVYVGVIASTTQ
jgi:hypothetical protein